MPTADADRRSTAASRSSAASRASVPRYLQIAKQLADAIASNRYAVGAKLPTEAELCKQFRISRYTAREALRQLRESGLISRRRGAGTTVAASAPGGAFTQSISSFRDVQQYADDTRLVIERRAMVDPASAADLLGTRRGREWLRMSAVRVTPGERLPVCLTLVYLAPDVLGIAAKLPRETGGIHVMIERELGIRIARIEQTINAVTLADAEAKRLGAPAGGPGLRVVRRYYDANDRLIEVSDSVHPGDRFTYSMTMRRD